MLRTRELLFGETRKKKKKKKTRRKKSKTKIREHTFRTKLRVERPLNDKKVSPKIRTHTHKKKIILMTEKRESHFASEVYGLDFKSFDVLFKRRKRNYIFMLIYKYLAN